MKKLILYLVFLNISIVFCQTLQIGDQQYIFVSGNWFEYNQNSIGSQIIPNKIVISCVNGSTINQVNMEQYGLTDNNIIGGLIGEKYYVIDIPENLESFTIATSMSNNPIIDYIKFDVITTTHSNPDDPYFIDESQWNLSLIEMEKAWEINYGSEEIIVAVIAWGIDLTHDELDGNLWNNIVELNGQTNVDDDGNDYVDDFYGWDFQASNGVGDNDPNPDYLGEMHGTQCAGIISAETNNNQGIASVAGGWNGDGGVKIMALRSLATRSSVVEAIYYAADNGADVISMSGGYSDSDQALEDAVNYATNPDHDIVFVVSVGNLNNPSIEYPAAYDNTIAVGGVVEDDTRWHDAVTQGSNYGIGLDVMAPSGWRNIFCLIPWNDYSFQTYEMHGGTSAAAPHVSGLAALIFSIWPTKTWQEVRDIIRFSSEKVGPEDYDEDGWNQYYGYGRINAFYAVAPPDMPRNFVVTGNVGENPTSSWSPNIEPDLRWILFI